MIYKSFNREFALMLFLVHFCFNAQIDVSVTKNSCYVIYLKTGFYFVAFSVIGRKRATPEIDAAQ